jgi:hypothetical protein
MIQAIFKIFKMSKPSKPVDHQTESQPPRIEKKPSPRRLRGLATMTAVNTELYRMRSRFPNLAGQAPADQTPADQASAEEPSQDDTLDEIKDLDTEDFSLFDTEAVQKALTSLEVAKTALLSYGEKVAELPQLYEGLYLDNLYLEEEGVRARQAILEYEAAATRIRQVEDEISALWGKIPERQRKKVRATVLGRTDKYENGNPPHKDIEGTIKWSAEWLGEIRVWNPLASIAKLASTLNKGEAWDLANIKSNYQKAKKRMDIGEKTAEETKGKINAILLPKEDEFHVTAWLYEELKRKVEVLLPVPEGREAVVSFIQEVLEPTIKKFKAAEAKLQEHAGAMPSIKATDHLFFQMNRLTYLRAFIIKKLLAYGPSKKAEIQE